MKKVHESYCSMKLSKCDVAVLVTIWMKIIYVPAKIKIQLILFWHIRDVFKLDFEMWLSKIKVYLPILKYTSSYWGNSNYILCPDELPQTRKEIEDGCAMSTIKFCL